MCGDPSISSRKAGTPQPYIPTTYWQFRGRDYRVKNATPLEMDNLVSVVDRLKPKTILDIGSGWGRVYMHLKLHGLANNLTMCDFVTSMLAGCEVATGIRPDLWDGITLPYNDNTFDLVTSFSVLQHVPFKDLDRVFSEHVRVASQYILIANLAHVTGAMAPHCFVHLYDELFKRHKVKVLRVVQFGEMGRVVVRMGDRAHWLLQV